MCVRGPMAACLLFKLTAPQRHLNPSCPANMPMLTPTVQPGVSAHGRLPGLLWRLQWAVPQLGTCVPPRGLCGRQGASQGCVPRPSGAKELGTCEWCVDIYATASCASLILTCENDLVILRVVLSVGTGIMCPSMASEFDECSLRLRVHGICSSHFQVGSTQ